MIQRIQSLWLLLSALIMGAHLFLPYAWVGCAQGEFELLPYGICTAGGELLQPTYHLAILVGLSALLPLVTIFLFKRRMLQIRLCFAAMGLVVGVVLVEAIFYLMGDGLFADFEILGQRMKFLLSPLVALLTRYLAYRGILRDEVLVRSADRIR